MTMDALPNDAIGLYAHYFQQGGLRRHHDSSVANPFPKPSEFDTSDIAKLREVVIVLRKPPPSLLYAAGLSHAWNTGDPTCLTKTERLEDLPRNTGDMETAEIPCRKVLDDKVEKKKKKKAEAKAAANAPDADIQIEKVASKRCAGKEGASRKRRKVHLETPVHLDSEHVSSRIPLNHAKPLEALANEEHVSINTLAGRMGVLRNQIDEHVAPRPVTNVDELVLGEEKGQENVDSAFVDEGHGSNKGGLSGLRTQPSPIHHLDQRLESVKKPARDTIVPDAETSYSVGRFGNLPFTSQWGLTDSCRMDNFRSCRDMMLNLFTPADNEFFNEGETMEFLPTSGPWKFLCQLRSSSKH
ncbi:hypothetical protein Tco_0348956 [Tanacetum coccineum]